MVGLGVKSMKCNLNNSQEVLNKILQNSIHNTYTITPTYVIKYDDSQKLI